MVERNAYKKANYYLAFEETWGMRCHYSYFSVTK